MSTFEATPHTDDSGAAYLKVAGALDLAAAPQLIQEVKESQVLRLDLSEVEFMDSTGLGALITVRNGAREKGEELQLLAISRAVERVLELSGLTDVFGVADE